MKKSKDKTGTFVRLCALSAIALMSMISSPQLVLSASGLPEIPQQTDKKTTMTLKFRRVPIREVLNEIKRQTGRGFALSADVEKAVGNVSVDVENATVHQAMEAMLAGTGFEYSIVNNQIVVLKKRASDGKIRISGTVLDNFREPVAGAIVYVRGTSNSSEADIDGNFSLIMNEPGEIEISYIGFKPYRLNVMNDMSGIVARMEPDNMLEDVVVTGIFNKNKETFTGAVTSISEKELLNFKGQNLIATLKNIDPVLNVAVNNLAGSDPNSLPSLSIRGNASLGSSLEEIEMGVQASLNTPLIIMDGFEISLEKLMDYNDEDIASMNILKDASATAIYGSRGANGVIVITTKAPEAGRIKVYFKAGLNLEMPDLSSYNLMNAREKLQLEYENGVYDYKYDMATDVAFKNLYHENLKNVNRGVDTYWIGQPVRVGVGQRYNLNLTGGNNTFRWRASLGYNNIAGAMKGSDRNNFNGTIDLSYTHKRLIFNNQTSITTNKAQNSKYGEFSTYAQMNPYWPIHDENGELIKSYTSPLSEITTQVGNPLYNSTLNTYNKSNYTQIVNNFSIEWNIIDELRLRGQVGISKTFNKSDVFYPAEHTMFESYPISDAMKKGSYTYGTGEAFALNANATLSYSKTFAKKHTVYVGADFYISENSSYGYSFSAIGFPNSNLDFIGSSLGYADGARPSSSEGKNRALGYTANANYSYDNRYFIDGSFRADGSSLFGGNNRYAPFWSAGLGWNIHREKFMANQKFISNMKLRGSVGESGSQNFSSYQALSTYAYYTDQKYGLWNGAYLMGHGNPDLRWQKVFQWNVGLDLSVLDGRISAAVDVYNKDTRDLLSRRDLQASTGFTSYTENVGAINNKGVEAMLSGYIVRNLEKRIIWCLTGRIAYNRNTIVKLSDALKKDTQDALTKDIELGTLLFEGDPTNAIYAVRSLGIDPSTGNELYLTKDGQITDTWKSSDRVFLGSYDPKYRGNISSLFQWGGLSLNLGFGFYFGGYQYNSTLLSKVEIMRNMIAVGNVDKRVYEDRWQKPGDVKFFKKIDDRSTKATSRFVMKENVFEFQNIALQYTFEGPKLKEKAKIQSIILGVNMSDIFHLSTIRQERGTSYPFARHASMSLSLTF